MMEINTLKKYDKFSTAKLKVKAQESFNRWIRGRDKDLRCVSCHGSPEQAGHFYSSGLHQHMTFNEDNVAGQCKKCNYFGHGELLKYRVELEKRIGTERLEKLDSLSKMRAPFKLNRFYLIEVIEKYRNIAT